MSYKNVSKSTKCRRFFEEIEVLDFFVDNQELQPTSTPQPSLPHINEFNLVIENPNATSFDSHTIDINNSLA